MREGAAREGQSIRAAYATDILSLWRVAVVGRPGMVDGVCCGRPDLNLD
jgi:hypothetical protein